ncbi:PspA/IM30 family protein [Paenibacillus sp. JDR-2]|uniref:PspA/IM30 family protein n=1 Tax=Paenibacillus sp. (strain JDR-2) TaxID=324057 RepID=UPI000166662B|nr:PspA/IM30 family protein [Paenibacillus sp. JDR-2]ACS99806.1 phage shock protein A, PspA [Paenibacillus sp. JDR-2]
MGIFSRMKDLFLSRVNSPQEEHPVRILNAFIESYSEKLRELTVSVNKSESEWLLLKGKLKTYQVSSSMHRDKAEQAAKEGNADKARHWLAQAHSQKAYSQKLEPEVERLERTTEQLKDTLAQLENKLQTAKDMRQQFILRIEAAHSQLKMNAALNESFSASAMERLKEETFLAEAKAELMRSRS